MLKKMTHVLAVLCLGATPAAIAGPISDNANQGVVLNVLDELEIQYSEEEDGSIVFGVDSEFIIAINADKERETLSLIAFKSMEIPAQNRAAALDIINNLNEEYGMKFWLDQDGNLYSQIVFDTIDMTVSKKCVAASIRRIFAGIEIATEQLSSLAN